MTVHIDVHNVISIQIEEVRKVGGDSAFFVRDIVIQHRDGELRVTMFAKPDNEEESVLKVAA